MNLVDSSGWIELLGGGPNATAFQRLIHATNRLIVPTSCMLEVFKWSLRHLSEDQSLGAMAIMRQGRVVSLTEQLALAAAELGVKHQLALADSIILATAHRCKATLWTQDADFRDLPGVRLIAPPKPETN